jgi:hypothetical protein
MSENLINIEDVMRNTRRYWFIDGLSEITGGVLIIMIALSYQLIYLLEDSASRTMLLLIGQPALILLSAYFSRKFILKLKERFTYPRTGFVKFHAAKPNKRVQRILLVILIAGGVSIFISFMASMIPDRYLPVISSIFIGAYSWILGYFNGVKRFYIIAILIVIFGGLISWINLGGGLPYIYLLTGIGVIWVLSGGWTLVRYMSQTKPVQEAG